MASCNATMLVWYCMHVHLEVLSACMDWVVGACRLPANGHEGLAPLLDPGVGEGDSKAEGASSSVTALLTDDAQ
jgi:hypothetical protein